jgi:hypothetical protein
MVRIRLRRRRMRRGDWHLVHNLVVLERSMREPAPPVRERLERKLGPELTRFVLDSLDSPTARAA